VHSLIGTIHQRLRIFSGAGEGVLDLGGSGQDCRDLRTPVENYHDLIASDAGSLVLFANDAEHLLGRDPHYGISNGVPEGIVDLFAGVEVAE
jgi:hypothetical protein